MKLPYKNKILIKTVALLLTANLIFMNSYSQATEKKVAAIQLSFYKNSDESRTVAAIASTKNDSGKLVFVVDIKMNFYVLKPTGESLLASAFTDEGGKAVVQLPKNIAIDTSGLTITARIENDKEYANAEATGVVKDARLVLSISEADSSKIIKAVVTEIQLSGEEKPLAGVEVNFGIQRAFGTIMFEFSFSLFINSSTILFLSSITLPSATSQMETIGKIFANNVMTRNIPANAPKVIDHSTQLGKYCDH